MATGLIGTDRRPVPDELPASWGVELDQPIDPAHTVLTLAARRRAVQRASGLLSSCPAGSPAPPDRQPLASLAAHEILARLLSPPRVDLLNLWLIAAAERGQCASGAYWTSLAMLAARTTELDRSALAAALGDRGVWFVQQNPEWARLAKGLRPQPKDQISSEPNDSSSVEVTEEAVRANPELIMSLAPPWPPELTRAVIAIIARGQLQQRAARYASAVGARVPLQHYELLRSAVQQTPARELPVTPAGLRHVREALLALERTIWIRIEMQCAFSGEPIMVQRLEIPPW
ncbi:MAG TPA: hypothetical protein VFT17_11510 [Propionibacteriaceae bacterium]|nr:hypothetical protein [Propionibacteriaceae bacterium]